MFNFMNAHEDDMQSTAASDYTEASSTVTSFSDVGSALDLHATRRDVVDEPSQRQTTSIGVGLSDELMSQRQRPLLELIDRLRSLGMQKHLDLPQIVAVGMENVGKSSMIEGISGIKLPRASGTCTRCPIELRMKRNIGLWKCDVSLHIASEGEGVDPVQPQVISFGDPIFNADEVEDRVRRAQQAILTPSAPPADFLRATLTSTPELIFSKNYISILVQGPDVADLSFVDLPGLVASSRRGNPSDVTLIEELVTSYIRKSSTLILLAVACESDFYTQGAYQLVKKYDPEGERTIGVLTKPDRIARGEEEQWVRFIRNDEEELDLGWFCVKLPDTMQLRQGLSWEQARNLEQEWFRNTSPWNQLAGKYLSQLGIINLVEKLSKTLASLISQRLPELRDELEELLQKTEEELKLQPAPPSEDSLAEMMRKISSFCEIVARHSEGIPADKGLLQTINAKQADFRRAVLSMAPTFRPYKRSDLVADLPQVHPCEFLDGEEEAAVAASSCLEMYIDEVMDLLKRSRTRELPGYYPSEIPIQIIKEATTQWSSMIFNYFNDVLFIVSEHYKQLIEEYFKNFDAGGLLILVQVEMRDHIQRRREETREHLQWIMNVLKHPFTLNTRYLYDYKGKFLSYYKMYRYNVLNRSPVTYIQTFNSGRSTNYVSEVLGALNKMNIKDVKASDLAKLLPDDDFEPALELMAVVSAYFQVSSKQFIDLVPAIVDYDFVRGVTRSLQTVLYSAIFKDDPHHRCKKLLQEPRSVAAHRNRLQRTYQRLEAAKNELRNMSWMDK